MSVPISSLIPPFASSFFADDELLFGFEVSTMSFSQSSLGSEQDELLSLSENAISYFAFCFSLALIFAPISACCFFNLRWPEKCSHTVAELNEGWLSAQGNGKVFQIEISRICPFSSSLTSVSKTRSLLEGSFYASVGTRGRLHEHRVLNLNNFLEHNRPPLISHSL